MGGVGRNNHVVKEHKGKESLADDREDLRKSWKALVGKEVEGKKRIEKKGFFYREERINKKRQRTVEQDGKGAKRTRGNNNESYRKHGEGQGTIASSDSSGTRKHHDPEKP